MTYTPVDVNKDCTLREKFTRDEIISAYRTGKNYTGAAEILSAKGVGAVSRQLARHWVLNLDAESETQDGSSIAAQSIRARNQQINNNALRREIRELHRHIEITDATMGAIDSACAVLSKRPPLSLSPPSKTSGKRCTAELLLSDLQIGKLGANYNTKVARARLFEFGRAARRQIEQKMQVNYRIERIVLALLGDLIESDKKHKNSARATDSGTAEQMHNAIVGIFELVLEPLASLGIPIDVICITGNHDHDDHGLMMWKPGREQFSWPMYHSLAKCAKYAGLHHVKFHIPEGAFKVIDIYGQKVLYEHGVGVSVNESSMRAHKVKRSEQIQDHITYFRMGDKHNVSTFNSGQYVVNGAFFGASGNGIEYSEIAGYSSIPAQWLGFHVPRKDCRFTLYDSFTIQLDHITE